MPRRSRSDDDRRLLDRLDRVVRRPAATPDAVPTVRAHSPRRPPRKAAFAPGWVEIEGRRTEVVVSDWTERGVRAESARRLDLPQTLLIVAPTLGLRRAARVAWRRGSAFGLEFVASS